MVIISQFHNGRKAVEPEAYSFQGLTGRQGPEGKEGKQGPPVNNSC